MKRYDRDYFDRWYRNRTHQVRDGDELRRKVRLAVAAAELVLERDVGTVLDVGCGEARWFPELRRLRPAIQYLGLESSRYAVEHFGKTRNVREASFGDLAKVHLQKAFDLVICTDVLHYLEASEIDVGLPPFAKLVGGAAYIDAAVREDDPEGDLEGWKPRTAAWYRSRFRRVGLVECGMGVWVRRELAAFRPALEVR